MNKNDKNLNSKFTSIVIDRYKDKYPADYLESQTGPQEEPCLVNYSVNLKQFRKYQKKNKKQ